MNIPNLGIGIGLRPFHYEAIISNPPKIDWFEIISENFMFADGSVMEALDKILEHYPVVMHGTSLSIGSVDPLDFDYLRELKRLIGYTKSPWVSDHLCWGRLPNANFHDLLPLPYTAEIIDYVAERARIVQDYLEVPFALENLSSYASYKVDEMEEWDFYRQIVEKAGVLMMLDVNNIYVSSRNHNFDPKTYIKNIPIDLVCQFHIAGHSDYGDYCYDSHDNYVCDAVWELYEAIYPKERGISTLLEWDDNFISFEATCKEAQKAKQFQKKQNLLKP